MGNPFEGKFKEFASTLTAKNAADHADATATKSGEVFKDKPFSEEYHTLYRVATIGQSGSQLITFCTTAALGVFALTHIIPLWWGIYLAVPLGIGFAFGVERVKRSTLAIASKHLLKYKEFGFVGIVAVLTLFVSIAAALYGAKELPGVVYAKPERTTDATAAAALAADINRVQADIDRVQGGLKAGKNWTAENRTLPRLQKERAALVERRDAATTATEGRADAQLAEAQQERAAKVEKMQAYSVGAAIAAELIFLLCTVFVFYYLFRHYAEQEAEQQGAADLADPAAVTFSKNGTAKAAANLRTGEGVRYTLRARADDNRTEAKPDLTKIVDDNRRLCDHCKTPYIYRHSKQRFCSDGCRIAAWENQSGKKLKRTKATN